MSGRDFILAWITVDMVLVTLAALTGSMAWIYPWVLSLFTEPDSLMAIIGSVAGTFYFAAFAAIGPLLLLENQANRVS